MKRVTRYAITNQGDCGISVSRSDFPAKCIGDTVSVVLASDYDKAQALIVELGDALNELRKEHEEAKALLKQLLPEWHKDAEDTSLSDGSVACEITWKDVRDIRALVEDAQKPSATQGA